MRRRNFIAAGAAGMGFFAGCGSTPDTATDGTSSLTRRVTESATQSKTATEAPTETTTETPQSVSLPWERLPGPPGGPVTDIGVSRADPTHLYVSTQTAGLYASRDGGETWVQGPESEHHGRKMVASPHDPLKARRPGNRTVDGGRTWFTRSYGSDKLRLPNSDSVNVHHIEYDPHDDQVLYVGAADGVYRTTDGGRTWSRMNIDVNAASDRVTWIDTASGSEGVVYAAYYADGTVVRSSDYGATWEVVAGPNTGPTNNMRGLAVTSDGETAYVCIDNNGLYEVTDETMRKVAPNVGAPYFLFYDGPTITADDERVYFHAFTLGEGETSANRWESMELYEYDQTSRETQTVTVPENQSAITAHPTDPETLYFGGWSWLWRSDDRGNTWTPLSNTFVDRYVSTVGVNPDRPGTVVPGSVCSSGLWVSFDGGETYDWKRSGLEPYHEGEFGEHYILDVAAGESYIYAASGAGLLISTDNGVNWRLLNTEFSGRGSPGEPSTPHAGVGINPSNPTTVYVGGGLEGPGPVKNAIWDTARIWKSTDGGETWSNITSGPISGRRTVVQDLLVSRHGSATVYAGTLGGNKRHPTGYQVDGVSGYGLFKSTDRGSTWGRLSTPFSNVFTITEDAAKDGKLYVSALDGAYRSNDGGQTWEEALEYPTRSILAHPTESDIVFAGGQKYQNYWDLLVSTDGGETWVEGDLTIQVGREPNARQYDGLDPNADYKRENGHIIDLAVDQAASELFAATRGAGLWRTTIDEVTATTD